MPYGTDTDQRAYRGGDTVSTPEWRSRMSAIARTTAGRKLDVTVGVVDVEGFPTAALAIDEAPPVTLTDEEMKHLAVSAYAAVYDATKRRRS